MNIFITLDYELFFGSKTGTVEHSLINPTNRLLKIGNKYGVKFSFFIDIGYIIKLEKFKSKYYQLQNDYDLLAEQIKKLSENGHDIQLHIHPHWEDSFYDGQKWHVETYRYRLHDFSESEILAIVTNYKRTLERLVDKPVFAYRAGGWCLQPFEKIKDALQKNGIWLDSTVYKNGLADRYTHFFDFRNMPNKEIWKFDNDPLIENKDGFFTEIPISSLNVSPLFFWKMAFIRKFGANQHKFLGDGYGIGASKKDILRMLLKPSNIVVSIDGYRSSLLQRAIAYYEKKKRKYMVLIGHPKMQSEFSLKKLQTFLFLNKDKNFCTYTEYFKKKTDYNGFGGASITI